MCVYRADVLDRIDPISLCVYQAYKIMLILTSLQVKLLKDTEIAVLDSSCHLHLTLQCMHTALGPQLCCYMTLLLFSPHETPNHALKVA